MARIKKMEKGGKSSLGMKSVKAGFDKNPGITRADIIVAAKKEAKDGKNIKKAQDGAKAKVALRTGQLKRVGRLAAKNPDKAEKVAGKMVERSSRRQRGKEYIQKNLSTLMPKSESGKAIKKAMYGVDMTPDAMMKMGGKASKKAMSGTMMYKSGGKAKKMMKMGGKCKYGC